MLSPEFRSTVKSGNLLRVRIMLKDSLIVDPTFFQFNEMFAYARCELPDLLVPYDGEVLENDRTKWNKELMNKELVEFVDNFSDVRIDHLKKVISVVLNENIRKKSITGSVNDNSQQRIPQSGSSYRGDSLSQISSELDIEQQKRDVREKALSQITNSSKKIESVMNAVQAREKYMLSDIYELEDAANQILFAARNYKNNR